MNAATAPSPSVRMRTGGSLEPGQMLGRYRLLVPIAAGGMGQVWAARQLGSIGMNRLVAIKTALPKMQRTEDFEQLFLDEGRIAAAIQHPNVCAIYDIGNEDGELFIAMEWINGGSLSMLIRDALLHGIEIPVAVAARIVANAATGLQAAHSLADEEGKLLHVIHRDVSPQNILISGTGHVKVADFGVAKARGQLHQATETGAFRGKVSYMAPEQFRTKSYDRRVDIFALGCVFYQLLTGEKPFDGDDQMIVMYKVVEGDFVPPRQRRPDIPQELEAILLKAMAQSPEDRWASAGDLARAIEGWLASTGAIVGEEEIAALVMRCFGPRIEDRAREVREASDRFGEGQGPNRSPDRTTGTTDVAVEVPQDAAIGRGGASAKRRRAAAPVAIALLSVVVSASAGLAYRKLKGPEPAKAGPDTVAAAAALAPATPPPAAVVLSGGEPPQPSPLPALAGKDTSAPSASSSAPVSATNGAARAQSGAGGALGGNQPRVGYPKPAAPGGPVSAASAAPAVAPAAPSAPSVNETASAPAPGKPHRALDTANPYLKK
jgi:hypothetical protein